MFKRKIWYLYGIPGVRMTLVKREPEELDYDEECMEGDYLPFTKDRGAFYDSDEGAYIYLRNGETKGEHKNWKETLENIQLLHEHEMAIREIVKKWEAEHAPPHPLLVWEIIEKKLQNNESFKYQISKTTKGEYAYIVEDERIFAVTNEGITEMKIPKNERNEG